MKKLINIVLCVIVSQIIFAQTWKEKRLDASLSQFYSLGIGDNFVNDSYTDFAGTELAFTYYFDVFSIELETSISYPFSVKNVSKFGNFNNVIFTNYSINFSYYFPLLRKAYAEAKLGLGQNKFDNHNYFDDYEVSGNTYTLGFVLHHHFTDTFEIFGGLHYTYASYNINYSGKEESYYTKSSQFYPKIGIAVRLFKRKPIE